MILIQKHVTGLTESSLARFVVKARRAAGLIESVDVVVTSNTKMRSLNRRFRQKDTATDVLSFPSDGVTTQRNFAGEIAVSAEIAVQNAERLSHSAVEEVKILVLHGILHLRGYDHERDHGEMAQRERQLRAKLQLPAALIERARTRSANKRKSAIRKRRSA